MLRNLFFKSLRDMRVSVFWWCLGFVVLSLYITYFYPYFSRTTDILTVIDQLPPIVKNLIGEQVNLATPEGFFNVQPFSMMAPLLFLIFAIVKAGDGIAGEIERGTFDLLCSLPLRRWRIVMEKMAALAVSLSVIAVVFWLGMIAGVRWFSISMSPMRLGEAIFSCWLLALTFATLTQAITCRWQRKRPVMGVVSGYAMMAYLVNAYAPMVKVLEPYRGLSLFYYYNGSSPLINGLNPGHVLVMAGLTGCFFMASILLFQRADLSG